MVLFMNTTTNEPPATFDRATVRVMLSSAENAPFSVESECIVHCAYIALGWAEGDLAGAVATLQANLYATPVDIETVPAADDLPGY